MLAFGDEMILPDPSTTPGDRRTLTKGETDIHLLLRFTHDRK
jgi:hypothetical protein